MAYTRDQATEVHKDYQETVNIGSITLDHTMVAMII